MPESQMFIKIAEFLGPAFGRASEPVQPSAEQREKLMQAQHVRNLLSEGIKENPAEIAERQAQESKKALELSCAKDGIDKVTGRATMPICKAFESPKAF